MELGYKFCVCPDNCGKGGRSVENAHFEILIWFHNIIIPAMKPLNIVRKSSERVGHLEVKTKQIFIFTDDMRTVLEVKKTKTKPF